MTTLLTTLNLVDAVDNDDTAVCTLERALQSLDEGSPEMFFVCLGVGSTAGFVVCDDKGVITGEIESVLESL